jgi:hypothetical protein
MIVILLIDLLLVAYTGQLQISYLERSFNNSKTKQKMAQPVVSNDTR